MAARAPWWADLASAVVERTEAGRTQVPLCSLLLSRVPPRAAAFVLGLLVLLPGNPRVKARLAWLRFVVRYWRRPLAGGLAQAEAAPPGPPEEQQGGLRAVDHSSLDSMLADGELSD